MKQASLTKANGTPPTNRPVALAGDGELHAHLPRSRRIAVLLICSMSLLIVGLDVTIVNVALPSIRRELHAGFSELQWTVDAYTVVLASLLLLSGSTADRVGRRRVFRIGLSLFGLGSLACGLAPSIGALIAFRALQAVGGSMLNPVAMSIIRNVFDDPRERAQAIGVWGAMVGLSLALGPVVGGALVDSLGWRAVFFVNVPVVAAALILTTLFVPESRALRPRPIDLPGQVLVIVGLASLTYAIIAGGEHGFGAADVIALFAVAAVSLAGLLGWELNANQPLIQPRFFKSLPFSGASAIAVFAFACQGGFLLLNTLYLQSVRGLSPLHAGIYTLPMAGMTLLLAPLSGRLTGRRGARIPLALGGLLLAAAGLMLTRITPTTDSGYLLGAYFCFGAGFGLINPPITNTAVSGMPPEQAGVAAAVASTSRQVGQTLGVAVLGVVAAGSVSGVVSPRFAAATHPAWWIVVALGAAIVVLGIATTGRYALETARRTAEALRRREAAERRLARARELAAAY